MPKQPMTITQVASLGGRAAAANATPEERSARARAAAIARWKKYRRAAKKAKQPRPS